MLKRIEAFLVSVLQNSQVKNILIISLFGLIFCSLHMGPLVPGSHDGGFHIPRFMGTVRSWQDGQIVPQLDPAVLDGMGYAPNLFYGPLSSYIVVFFRAIVFDWNIAINLSVIFTVVMSGVTMYFLMRRVGKNDTVGLLSAIAYMGAPYHLINATLRFAVGENLGLVFAPLIFLGIWKILHNERGWLAFGIGVGGVAISHNLSTLVFVGFAAMFMAAYAKRLMKWSKIKQFLIGAALAFGLSAFFLLPLAEAKMSGDYNAFLPGFMSTNASEFSHASSSLNFMFYNDEKPYTWIGLVFIVTVLLLPMVYKFLSREHRRFVNVALVLTGLSLVLQTKFFPWNRLPDSFAIIQFPWRLNIISTLLMSCVGGLVFYSVFKHSRKAALDMRYWSIAVVGGLTILGMVIVGQCFPRDTVNAYKYQDSEFLESVFVSGGGGRADYLPNSVKNYADREVIVPEPGHETPWTWSGYEFEIIRPNLPQALSGSMTVSSFWKEGSHMGMDVEVDGGGIIELPVIFYPGYKVRVNDKKVKTFESENGFAAFRIDGQGEHKVQVHYGATTATKIGLVIGVITLTVLIVLLCIKTCRRKRDNEAS